MRESPPLPPPDASSAGWGLASPLPTRSPAPPGRWPAAPGRGRLDLAWLRRPGREALISGQFARAARIYQAAVQLAPTDPLLRLELAQALTNMGWFAQARDAYQQVLRVPAVPRLREEARRGLEGLARVPAPLVVGEIPPGRVDLPVLTRQAVHLAQQAEGRAQGALAGRYWMAALLLDEQQYDGLRALRRLGRRVRAIPLGFYLELLRVRPGGYLARLVLEELRRLPAAARARALLGTLQARLPAAGLVYVNGELWSGSRRHPVRTTRGVLPPGRYDVQLECSGGLAVQLQVEVAARRESVVRYPWALVELRLTPPPDQAWLDGLRTRLQGRSLFVSPGRHELLLRSAKSGLQGRYSLGLGAAELRRIVAWPGALVPSDTSTASFLFPGRYVGRSVGPTVDERLRRRQAGALLAAARRFASRRRWTQAHALLRRAVVLRPTDPAIRQLLGVIQARVGDLGGALETVHWVQTHVGETAAEQLRAAQGRALARDR